MKLYLMTDVAASLVSNACSNVTQERQNEEDASLKPRIIVTGDDTFFANDEKFYDYVIENLPYYQQNSSKIETEKIGSWGRILNFHGLDDCGSIGTAIFTFAVAKGINEGRICHVYEPTLYAGGEMARLIRNEELKTIKTKPGAQNSIFHFLLKNEWLG